MGLEFHADPNPDLRVIHFEGDNLSIRLRQLTVCYLFMSVAPYLVGVDIDHAS